jgi:hypothetical protein
MALQIRRLLCDVGTVDRLALMPRAHLAAEDLFLRWQERASVLTTTGKQDLSGIARTSTCTMLGRTRVGEVVALERRLECTQNVPPLSGTCCDSVRNRARRGERFRSLIYDANSRSTTPALIGPPRLLTGGRVAGSNPA